MSECSCRARSLISYRLLPPSAISPRIMGVTKAVFKIKQSGVQLYIFAPILTTLRLLIGLEASLATLQLWSTIDDSFISHSCLSSMIWKLNENIRLVYQQTLSVWIRRWLFIFECITVVHQWFRSFSTDFSVSSWCCTLGYSFLILICESLCIFVAGVMFSIAFCFC